MLPSQRRMIWTCPSRRVHIRRLELLCFIPGDYAPAAMQLLRRLRHWNSGSLGRCNHRLWVKSQLSSFQYGWRLIVILSVLPAVKESAVWIDLPNYHEPELCRRSMVIPDGTLVECSPG